MTDAAFDLDEMKEIIDEFLIEADEIISKLDSDMVRLEKTPDDLDLLNEIFRSAHTVKGTSGFLGFEKMSELTHKMEDILNKLRKNELKINSDIMDALLEAIDTLKLLIEDVKTGADSKVDVKSIETKLEWVMKAGATESATEEPEKKTPAKKPAKKKRTAKSKKAVSQPEPPSALSPESEQQEKPSPEDQHDLESPVAEEEAEVESDSDVSEAAQPETTSAKSQHMAKLRRGMDQTIRVDVERLDNLMNIMGELVLGRNALTQLTGRVAREHEGDELATALNRTTTQINFITTELQMAVMKMRMLPIGKVFNKFPRVVRDLARSAGKEIDLEIIGEETELDRSVIEEIGDPLVHLVRNAADHGVETPDEREAAGKSRVGKIQLIASQEGSHIVIKIIDDGAGLNLELIRAKAVERGFGSENDIAAMSDKDVFSFIFHPGFSTAKVVTDVSGRGVGMDVVRTNIEKLKGMIELDSKSGKGTSVVIKLPLTLAIVLGLLVEARNELFILPLSSVVETKKTNVDELYTINQKEVIRLRDEVLPVVDIHNLLFNSNSNRETQSNKETYIVVIGLAEKKLGLLVDKLIGQEEVVIKSLGDFLGGTRGIAGATILGDGRVRLIVDPAGVFNMASQTT